MKSEKRHQLEQNALANWLAQSIKTVEPYLKPIVVSLAIVALAFLAVTWWRGYSARGSATALNQFMTAFNSQDITALDDVAQDNPGTTAAHWAALEAANLRLAQGSQFLFIDRANATQQLNKAVDGFTIVIKESREPRQREGALFGRARAYESLAGTRQSEGELDKAVADYEALVNAYPDGPYATYGKQRVDQLKSADAKKFYDKFAAYTPKPPSAKDSLDLPGLLDSSNLPEGPGAEFSKILDGLGAPKDSKTGEAKKEPGKTEPGKPEAGKTDAGNAAPAKTEAPKAEAPAKSEPAKPELPKAEPKK